jgi:hypothetical protein
MPALAPDQGRIIMFSPATDVALVAPEVWMDDEVVGAVPTGGFFFLDRPIGNHVIEMQREALNLSRVLRISVEVAAGETTYVRFTSFGSSKTLEVRPLRTGEAEVMACSYYGDESRLAPQSQ